MGVLRSFSSSLLLCEQIFILAETSCIIAVEGHTRSVFPKFPGRVNWPKAWDSDGGSAAPPGHGTAVDLRLWKKSLLCLLVAFFVSLPSIQPSTSLIIPPLGHRWPKAFSTVLSKEEQQCLSQNTL